MANKRRKWISKLPVFRGLPLHTLVGRPLVSAVMANEAMSKEQVRFLMRVCFSLEGEVYTPILVPMKISRGSVARDASGALKAQSAAVDVKVPLITLLPISNLYLERFAANFDLEMLTSFPVEKKMGGAMPRVVQRGDADSELTGRFMLPRGVAFSGANASVPGGPTPAADMSVELVASSLPLPVGVTTLLGAYSKAILPEG